MRLKYDVVQTGVVPEIWHRLGRIDGIHLSWTGRELVVTDLWRESSPWSTVHVPDVHGDVLAADLRRWYLDKSSLAEPFARYLQMRFSPVLIVVLEPEWLTPRELEIRGGVDRVAPHIHVELTTRGFNHTD